MLYLLPPREASGLDLRAVRQEVQAFSVDLAREWYLLASGQKEAPEIVPIYARYPGLADRSLLAAVRAARTAPDPPAARRADHLYEFLVGYCEGHTLRDRDQQLEQTRLALRVRAGDREVPFSFAQVLVATEPDRSRRDELARRLEQATGEHLNPLAEQLVLGSHGVARELGYADYVSCWDDVKRLDLAQLLPLADRILAETHDLARNALAADLDRYLGLTPEEADTHDYAFLNRAPQFDPLFPPDALVSLLRRATRAMGIDIGALPNVRLDLERRETKSPRAFCATIRVPEEVVLVVMPHGGQEDYQAVLHEAGHALHYGHVQPGTAFEFARLGDQTLTEVYAFLFQHLLQDPEFLATYMSGPLPLIHEYVRFAVRAELVLVRRYCAKLRYELQLHRTDALPAMAAVYSRELRAATFLPYRPAYYLTDLDPGFYSAQYLRAWVAEAQVRRHLRQQFGRRWWSQPATGDWLKGVWRLGTRYRLGELLQTAGQHHLDPQPLLEDFQEKLG